MITYSFSTVVSAGKVGRRTGAGIVTWVGGIPETGRSAGRGMGTGMLSITWIVSSLVRRISRSRNLALSTINGSTSFANESEHLLDGINLYDDDDGGSSSTPVEKTQLQYRRERYLW